jgi:hypothetical protein
LMGTSVGLNASILYSRHQSELRIHTRRGSIQRRQAVTAIRRFNS